MISDMETFLRCTALALLSVILTAALKTGRGDFSQLLALAACCLIGLWTMRLLRPVLEFVRQLQSVQHSGSIYTGVLLKCTGVSMLGQIACGVCADGGNSAVARILQILTAVAVMYLSLPVFSALLELIERISEQL